MEHDLEAPNPVVAISSNTVNKNEKPKSSATHIFQALQYLRKLCNHPLLVVNEKHPSYYKVQEKLRNSNQTLHDIQNAPKLLALK